MKVQNVTPTVRAAKKATCKPGNLSNDAFYLIALALLLKKETGASSLSHYLYPDGLPVKQSKTAA